MSDREKLSKIVQLLKSKDNKGALALIVPYIRDFANDPQGWFLLGLAIDEPQRKIDAFKKALVLDPNHAHAQQQLARLIPADDDDEEIPAWLKPAIPESEDHVKPIVPSMPSEKSAQAEKENFEFDEVIIPPPPIIPPAPEIPPPPVIPESEYDAEPEKPKLAMTSAEAEAQPLTLENVLMADDKQPQPDEGEVEAFLPANKVPKKRNWVRWLTILIILGLIGGGSYWLWINGDVLIAQFIPTATPTSDAPSTETATLVPTQTLPAIWTATPFKTATQLPATNTATPVTATNTPTPLPLAPAVQSRIVEIQADVSLIRGLEKTEDVRDELMPTLKLRLSLLERYITDELRTQLIDDEIVLTVLGFMDGNYDLVEAALEDYADYIGGFYLPEENHLHILGTSFTGDEEYIYSHEYMHALQDMHFDLNSLGVYPECVRPQQECLAIRSLVEGEASYVMDLWWGNFATYETYRSFDDFTPPSPIFSSAPPPPYFGMDSFFAYQIGAYFVASLESEYDWNYINKIYNDRLPITTEQVLHPDKYIKNERAVVIQPVDLSPTLGEGWRLVETETLGEWDTLLLMFAPNDPNARVDIYNSWSASEGWGGDVYSVYVNDETGDVALAAQWVWDNQAHQIEFASVFAGSLAGRFDDPSNPGPCWQSEEYSSCLTSRGSESLWLLASTQEQLEALQTSYPQFP